MLRLLLMFTRPGVLLLLALAGAAAPDLAKAGPIQDNSFLLEEAYNQEPGVIQHIGTFNRSPRTGAWESSYTEEWPVRGQTHQASVTLLYADQRVPDGRGLEDVLLNYRWQAVGGGDAPVAFSPRLSLILPTGDGVHGLGAGGAGLEVNLPLSVVLSDRFVSHVNLGGRWVPDAEIAAGGAQLSSFTFGQSLIWLAHRNVSVMLEAVYTSSELTTPGATSRAERLTVNPGLRAAINLGGLQIVPGFAVPIGVGPSRGENALFFYLSFEHPFRLAGPTDEPAGAPGA